jgi:hypothetical protein
MKSVSLRNLLLGTGRLVRKEWFEAGTKYSIVNVHGSYFAECGESRILD